MPESIKTQRHRNWILTSFKPELYSVWSKTQTDGKINYFCFQKEKCPTSGREHLQGYIEFNDKTSIKQIKKILEDNALHCEARRGTQADAIKYCSKIDTRIAEPVILGKPKEQGKRKDLETIYTRMVDGASLEDIQKEYPNQYMRYYKGIDKVLSNIQNKDIPHFKNVETSIFWGSAGTNKTRTVYDRHKPEDVYRLRLTNNGVWFDGYIGQKVLLIDDFYGSIKFHDMLEYMDGYKFQVPIKGGFVWKAWDKVYITSNKHPNEWYANYRCLEEPAFVRRINEFLHFPDSQMNKNHEIEQGTYIKGIIIPHLNPWLITEWNKVLKQLLETVPRYENGKNLELKFPKKIRKPTILDYINHKI